MSDIKVHFYDYSYVKIETSFAIFKELRDHYTFFVEGYQFSPRYIYGTWSGKISLLDKDGMLPFGLVSHLKKFCRTNMYDIEIHQDIEHTNDMTQDEFNEWLDNTPVYSGGEQIYPYWYQSSSIYEALVNKRRILNLPTSAGKSLIQGLLTKFTISNSDQNVLIIVPNTGLVSQMRDDFIDYQLFKPEEIAMVKSGSTQKKERIVVSTWQSAVKKKPEWFNQFGMLIVDEVHLANGASISKIVKMMRYCEYKIGLSGSLRDGKSNIMQYVGLFGDIYKPVTTSDLMEAGQVTKLKINALFLKYPEFISNQIEAVDYITEVKFISKLKRRSEWIANLAITLTDKNENVFLMFRTLEYGKELLQILKDKGHTNVHYVAGDIKPEKRDELKKLAETNSGMIIIASYGVFSTGISIKNLHHVIFCQSIKSKVLVLQTIGRVLRKHGTKSVATVWDIIDDMSITVEKNGVKSRKNVNYLLKHGVERIERYAKEEFNYIMKDIYFIK